MRGLRAASLGLRAASLVFWVGGGEAFAGPGDDDAHAPPSAPPAALPAQPPRRDPAPPAAVALPAAAPAADDRDDADNAAPDGGEPPPFDLGIRLFAAVDAAALPKPAPGLGGGAALQVEAWRGEIFGAYFPEQTQLTGRGGEGAEVSLMLAVARLCWVPLRRRIEVGGCLGGEAGIERAVAFGVDDPDAASAPWLAPQAALVGHLHLTPIVATFASVDFAIPVAKERFVFAGIGDVHGAPDATARLTIGFELGP